MLGVLRGAFIFLADLSRVLTVPRRVDFIALSSYDSPATAATGAVRLVLDVRAPLRGKHVLVVEDIVDTGYTLQYLIRTLQAREPASLKTAVGRRLAFFKNRIASRYRSRSTISVSRFQTSGSSAMGSIGGTASGPFLISASSIPPTKWPKLSSKPEGVLNRRTF